MADEPNPVAKKAPDPPQEFLEFGRALMDVLEMQWHPDAGRHQEQADKLAALRKALRLPDELPTVEEAEPDLSANSGEAKE